MKEKGKESSSSLVIVSRRMLIAGIAGTALFSFGLGYFFGYGGSNSARIVNPVEADNRVGPSEERTVLDSSGNPTIVPPPATPGVIPKELPLVTRRNNEVASAPRIHQELPSGSEEKKPVGPIAQDSGKAAVPEKGPAVTEKTTSAVPEDKGKEKEPENADGKDKAVKEKKGQPGRTAKKAGHKHAVAKGGHYYQVQVGSFSDQEKAKQLKKLLLTKGFKAHITTYSPSSGETMSRVRIGRYATKKEAEELLSGLKGMGFDGVVFYGSR
jgi:cell division protein FtsN